MINTKRIYITASDVSVLIGCKHTKAYKIIKAVNDTAVAKGYQPFGQGKANKYIFSEMYGIPIKDVDAAIERGNSD